jgi:hypothetical protein
MAFTGNYMPTSFKIEILNGVQNFSADTFKIALYTSSATLDANTTAYTTSNEVASGGNYVTGGNTLSVTTTPTNGGSGTTAYVDFADTTWSAATITARGALIYNNSQANSAVAVLDFGSDKTSTSGDFTIQFPAATNTTAIIRIA